MKELLVSWYPMAHSMLVAGVLLALTMASVLLLRTKAQEFYRKVNGADVVDRGGFAHDRADRRGRTVELRSGPRAAEGSRAETFSDIGHGGAGSDSRGGRWVTVNRRSDSGMPTAASQQGATVDYPIIWPQDLVGGKAGTGPATDDPGPTAERFLDELGVPTSDLAFSVEQDSRGEARLVKVTKRDGSVLGTVSLRRDAGGGAWGVQAMQSPRTTVRHPRPNGAANPPLSVNFRPSTNDTARIRLLDARNSKELTSWSENVDPDEYWYAHANFTREANPFPGYLVLTEQDDDGHFTSVVVMPLTIGIG